MCLAAAAGQLAKQPGSWAAGCEVARSCHSVLPQRVRFLRARLWGSEFSRMVPLVFTLRFGDDASSPWGRPGGPCVRAPAGPAGPQGDRRAARFRLPPLIYANGASMRIRLVGGQLIRAASDSAAGPGSAGQSCDPGLNGRETSSRFCSAHTFTRALDGFRSPSSTYWPGCRMIVKIFPWKAPLFKRGGLHGTQVATCTSFFHKFSCPTLHFICQRLHFSHSTLLPQVHDELLEWAKIDRT